MAVTRLIDALRALRAQRDATTDPAKLRAIRRTIRTLRGSDDPAEEAQDLADAFQEIRDMEATPALFEAEQWRESAVLLMQNLGTLPEDDPDPSVLDKRKIQLCLKRTVENAASELDPAKPAAAEWLERFFGLYLDARPAEATLAPIITSLEGGELDAATLATTLAALESNAGALKPPAEV